jgi:cell division protein FtsZ
VSSLKVFSAPLDLAFRLADDVLRQGIQGITELITEPGLINVDFAHIRQVMQMGGGSVLSIGVGEGEDKARQAIDRALHHPLLDTIHLENANSIIANFTAGPDLSFVEVVDALNDLQVKANHQAEIIPGVITDPRMTGRAQVILIITGLGATAIDVSFGSGRRSEPVSVASAARPQPVQAAQPVAESASYQTDLELPAFLRRRVR